MKKLMIAAAVACVASVLVSGCTEKEQATAADKAADAVKAAADATKVVADKAADAVKSAATDAKKEADAAKPAAK